MIKDGIMEVTEDVANQIIQSSDKEGKYRPRGLFWVECKDETGKYFVGIDNQDGCCLVEDFRSKRSCFRWLKGGDLNGKE